MLTILAWFVFVIACCWHLLLLIGYTAAIKNREPIKWGKIDSMIAAVGFAALFIPGVYLFGIW